MTFVCRRAIDWRDSGGDRDGQHSVRVSRGWRICFMWDGADALEVELNNHYD